jgi:hypothetical protein
LVERRRTPFQHAAASRLAKQEIDMEHIETLESDRTLDRSIDPRRTRSPHRGLGWPLVMIAAVALAAILVWRAYHVPQPVVEPAPAVTPAVPAVTGDASPAPSAPRYPIEGAGPPAAGETAPLPAVADSDAALQDVMAGLFAGIPLDRVFHLQEIVPRFVATIDNLPRQTAALAKMPVNPVGGTVETTQANGQFLLRADNASRYSIYLNVMEHADTQKLVQTYVRYYPLFQKAYQDLGYPNGYFNDRLVEVIDHLLAAPEVPAPIALTQPKVLYEFADPSLEQRSAGQKILMRMGPVNEARVKAKLRDIRRAVTRQALSQSAAAATAR